MRWFRKDLDDCLRPVVPSTETELWLSVRQRWSGVSSVPSPTMPGVSVSGEAKMDFLTLESRSALVCSLLGEGMPSGVRGLENDSPLFFEDGDGISKEVHLFSC